jgi:hypothetical protein
MSGAPDQGGDDEVPLRRLPVPPPRPFARATASSLADSDNDVPSPLILHRAALLLCYGDAAIPLRRPGVSRLSSSTSPPIVRPQPAPQAVADALSGTVNTDFLLLLLLHVVIMRM